MNEEVKEMYEEFLETVNLLSIDEKEKCMLIMVMANVVSVVGRSNDPHLQASKLHLSTKEYAIRFAELSDNSVFKLLSRIFLEDK